MSTQSNQVQESKPAVCETYSVNLSVLVQQHIASMSSPEGWRVLAIDPLNDMVVLIREVKT
ncbi:MAG: hypothetical protein FWF66_07610 [Candidatus Bathyarchaeota archaeon]|nr:hypothetical protein [Candidatus Termiticorpusculum sp.]